MGEPLIKGSAGRDPRLDVFRGLALLTIFVNHVPGNPVEDFTSRNFGFSDAAEAFVLMSGIAVSYAYSGDFVPGRYRNGIVRVLKRARTLYLTHLFIMALALVIVGGGLYGFGVENIAERVNFTRLQTDPIKALIGFPLLTYQIGYFNILPLYVVLLVASIGFVWIGKRSVAAMLALSIAIWLVVHITGINVPNWPGDWGWFFNPIGWQLVFVFGIAAGLRAREGRKLVPFNWVLYVIACLFVIFAAFWVKLRMGPVPGLGLLPEVFSNTGKGNLAFLRLLHVLALAYVVSNTAWIDWICRSGWLRPIEIIGQNGLVIFAFGSVLAITLQVFFEIVPASDVDKVVILGAGILAQVLVAAYMRSRKRSRKSKAPAAETVTPTAQLS